MRNQSKPLLGIVSASIILLAAAVFTGAQTNVITSRITQAIDPANLTILRGNTHPFAQAQFDRGAAPATLPMQLMILVLKRSAQQENALDGLMEQQQDASSPNYHHWLTPQQFGQQYGPSNQDVQTISSWLQSQGFQIDQVSNGRTVIEFSGTAGEVQSAFHTAIHQYLVNGESRWANSSDPAIPTALTPVVAGIDSLYNFPRIPLYHLATNPRGTIEIGGMKPKNSEYTFPNPCNLSSTPFCNFALSPYDFAAIYNVLPLWNQTPAIDGTGETIAIVGESDINVSDVESFQKFFGMTVKDPTIIMDGPDPGTVPGDETESDLDVEWAGAVAKGANIDLVVSQSTEASLGVDLSAQYAVDNNLAPVLSESYGVCEFFLGSTGNTFYNQLWQQAAAQGITVVVATGDAGAATCDGDLGSQGPAQLGLSVNGVASTPYDVAMGGTDFNDLSDPLTYWNATNSTAPGSSGGVSSLSAKGYIPEMTWNDTCTNQEIFSSLSTTNAAQTCNDPTVLQQFSYLLEPTGGGGGKSGCTVSDGQNLSSCATPYSKPPWQTALTPADSVRDLPDVAMFASNGFNGSFYVLCEADLLSTSNEISVGGGYPSTSCDPTDTNTGIVGIGGTSAPTPAFAGIMALVNQSSSSRQGNANYILYKLAAQSGNTCSSAGSPAGTCVFYDVPSGSTTSMPCVSGTPNCNVTGSNQYGVLYDGSNPAYNTGTGYDLATGLGSVNVDNLVTKWKSFVLSLKGSSTTLTLTPPTGGSLTNLTHGQAVTFSTAVSAVAPATGTPSGTVALIANTGTNGQQPVQSVTLNSSGEGSSSTTSLPGGSYTVVGQYPGDGTFSSSTSFGTAVTVAPEGSKVQLAYELFNPNTGAITDPNATTAVFGTPAILRVNVTSATGDACANNAPGDSGCPTGAVSLTDSYNGGTATLLGAGALTLNLQGYAEDQLIDLAGGTHVLAATYPGDSSYSAPTPSPAEETLTVTPADTQTSMNAQSGPWVLVGSSVTLDAQVGASGIYSNRAETGMVTFMVGSAQVASATVGGSVISSIHQADASASVSTTSLPHGQDMITAQYAGDGSYSPSTSAPYSLSVLWPTTTSVTTSNPSIQYGSPVTFTAQVTSTQTGGPAISGNVNFTANGLFLGSSPLLDGSAQLTTSAVPGGAGNIYAGYVGDSNYAMGTGFVAETVTPISTITALTSSNNAITQGQSVTLTATITPQVSGPSLPTGSVQFLVNGTSLLSTFAFGGQAQFTTTTLPVGTDNITAVYTGDTNYIGSTSSVFTETVNAAPTFTVTTNTSAIAIPAPGQSGSAMVTFTGENGFNSNGNSPLTVMCGNLPAYSNCSVSPSSVNITTNGTATATLTITTTASSLLIPGLRDYVDTGGLRGPSGETVAATALLLLFCCGIALGFRVRQRRWGLAVALVALAFVFANAGCGGGSGGSGGGGGGGGGGGNTNPGTPVGTQAVQVSFTINGVTQAVPFTVDVQ